MGGEVGVTARLPARMHEIDRPTTDDASSITATVGGAGPAPKSANGYQDLGRRYKYFENAPAKCALAQNSA